MDAKKLKRKIIEHSLSVGRVAEKIGITETALYRKLGGKDKITINEANRLKITLELTDSEALEIFL